MIRHDTAVLCGGIGILLWTSFIGGQMAFRQSASTHAQPRPAVAGTPSAPLPGYKPHRIVSTDYKGDEMLLELVPPGRILALSPDADNPQLGNAIEAARAVAHRVDLDVERILALQPDLVIVGSADNPFITGMLSGNGVRVLQLNRAYTIAEIQQNVRAVGDAVGEPGRARAVVSEMERTLRELEARTRSPQPQRVLYVGSGRTYTAGIGTYTDELIRAAGGVNVAREAGVQAWGPLSVEKAVTMDPDVLFVPDASEERRGPRRVEELVPTPELSRDPVWRDVKAVREGRVYKMPNRLMMCASHLNVMTALAIARVLNPLATQPAID